MRFREKMESIRFVTMLKDDDDDDYNNDDGRNEKINNLNTVDDIKAETNRLIEQLKVLQKKAMEGQDVSRKLSQLEEKFEMIREIGELLAIKNSLKEKALNEKRNGKFHIFGLKIEISIDIDFFG